MNRAFLFNVCAIIMLVVSVALAAATSVAVVAGLIDRTLFYPLFIAGVIGLTVSLIRLIRQLRYAAIVFDFWANESGYSQLECTDYRNLVDELITTVRGIEGMLLEEKTNNSTKLLIKKAELAALQSQINPHFLYNTLDAIRGLALKRGVPEIAEMTGALSAIFRYSISSAGDFQTFEDDMENLDHYVMIQQYRFTNRFHIIKEFEDEEIIKNIEIPKLIIQPIVENAIYHGLEKTVNKGIIKISAFLSDKCFVINVIDNGVGMEQEMLEQINAKLTDTSDEAYETESVGLGIALQNVNKRIKLYYGAEYGLSLYSTKGLGTTVKITLPYGQSSAKR